MKPQLCSRCNERPAVVFVQDPSDKNSQPTGYCIKCAKELNIGNVNTMLKNMGISDEDFDTMTEQMSQFMNNADMGDFNFGDMSELFNADNADGAQTMPLGNIFGENSDFESNGIDENDKSGKRKKRSRRNQQDPRKFLNNYCTDLTSKAKNGKIDNIIGRDQEIARTVQILCRRTKNNPCLIGEPGVGKTAIAEGLAIRIAKGEVPARLADKEIFLLDLTALVAGTQFRGQFEGRIKGLVDEVRSEGNIILFIDEVHNLVGTGDSEGTMNAANILKPALSRGEIQVIGATTFTEYRKYIEKDAALERRFQPVKIEEPSIDDSYKMLIGIKSYYEDYHKVQISDTLVFKAVTMSERYVTDRYLPDKAIDLLDEACTCANLRNPSISKYQMLCEEKNSLNDRIENLSQPEEGQETDYELISKLKSQLLKIEDELPSLEKEAKDNQVLEADLTTVISMWTGIPSNKIVENDISKLASLESELQKHVVGQDKAISKISNAVRRGRVQISPKKRPQSFIFVGPTGVGKTELVKQLADYLFDSPDNLIRLDMSEFMEKFSVSRLIGSPPGYVGYDDAGQLTEKVRRKPYSIVLFDEIEKAHKDVLNILLQILDDGRITDSQGRTVDFSNTIIIMTSNAGSTDSKSVGFDKSEDEISNEAAMKGLQSFLKPEFLGRVDEIVQFSNLTFDNFQQIAKIAIEELVPSLKDKGIDLVYDDSVAVFIAKDSYGSKKNARAVRDSVRRFIEDELANKIVFNEGKAINKFELSATDKDIEIKIK